VTTWYPSATRPESGIFIARDVALLAREHDVEVIHLVNPAIQAYSSTENLDGIYVHRFPMSPSNPVAILRAARMIRCKLELFHTLHTMAFSALVPFFALRVSRPWLHTEHWSGIVAPHTVPFSMRITMPITRLLLKRPDVVVAVSDHLARFISAHRRGVVTVVPNAVSMPDSISPRQQTIGTLRLLGVGGLIPRKGPDIAVDAVAELVKRGVSVELTWLGEGPMRGALESQCRRRHLAEQVHFVGLTNPEGVAEALAECDVFVLPTKFETFGVAIAEALAGGRPVVTSGEGGHRDFVRHPDGIVVEQRDGVAIADAIEAVLSDNADRTAEQIAHTTRSRFSEETRAHAYAESYASALHLKVS
jgi:glycosyltransferase involved in cell wall biosynthesis